MRQSHTVQSVMQDYQDDLSYLLPVCNLLVQGPKITYNIITVCLDGQGYCGVLRWISFISNSLIHWTSNHYNFIFSTPTFVTWYFCFPHKICNMIPVFSKTYKGRYARFFPAGEKWNVINLRKKRKKNDFVSFKSQIFISSINSY